MSKSKPLVDADGEVRTLTAADMPHFRPAKDVLPKTLMAKLNMRGPQKSPTKERITIRLSPEVVQRFRDTGDGWQTRVDMALKDWLKLHQPANV
ncbi:MAG: BrnA antitoxin family protein [Rhodoferax sp.]|uniref:BrnA antitoxin family protein n=1 Tax=Rhodoferax sp. TaxID=50421 RepID=UPI0032641ED5